MESRTPAGRTSPGDPLGSRAMRRSVFLVYALLFANEIQQAGIIPLLPTFKESFELTKVETGAILSMTTFATVVVDRKSVV